MSPLGSMTDDQGSADVGAHRAADDPEGVGDVLDRLDDAAREGEEVSVERLVESFGERSYGPFLLVPALVEISPIGGIPLVPTFIAATIALFAIQIAFGRKHLWLPGFMLRRSVTSERVLKATKTLRPLAERLDRWFSGRWAFLTKGPFLIGAAFGCLLLSATVPPLELVPFASTIPMAAVAAFGLALLLRDGLLMVLAYGLAAATIGTGLYLLLP